VKTNFCTTDLLFFAARNRAYNPTVYVTYAHIAMTIAKTTDNINDRMFAITNIVTPYYSITSFIVLPCFSSKWSDTDVPWFFPCRYGCVV